MASAADTEPVLSECFPDDAAAQLLQYRRQLVSTIMSAPAPR